MQIMKQILINLIIQQVLKRVQEAERGEEDIVKKLLLYEYKKIAEKEIAYQRFFRVDVKQDF